MKNILISNLHKKNIKNFTTNIGLFLRKKTDKPFKKLCNVFTNAHIIRENINFPVRTGRFWISACAGVRIAYPKGFGLF